MVEEQLSAAAVKLQTLFKPLYGVISVVLPVLIDLATKAHKVYNKLPQDYVAVLIGLIFCFFGGLYPCIFAAVQAARHAGWDQLTTALSLLVQEAKIVIEADQKDNKKDENNDGKADVTELSSKELMMRKVNLVLTKINPSNIDKAFSSIYTIWIMVLATLKIEFARTIALSITISNFLKKPLNLYLAPLIQSAVPKEYNKWVPVVIGWGCKAVGISIAWMLQTIVSAFTSAMEGGLIVGRTLLKILEEHKSFEFLKKVLPNDHTETIFDEVVGYSIAALGFYTQFKLSFDVPFPFNLILFPFEFVEYYLKWRITGGE